MTPYYQSDRATLHLGDCLEIVAGLPAGTVDAVVSDPPYGIDYVNKRSDIRPWLVFRPIAGDDSTEVGQDVIDLCRSRGWPVCAFAHHRRPWAGNWRQWLVWDKGNVVGVGGDRRTCFKFSWELIQLGGFGALRGKREGSVLRYPITPNMMKDHPTQKPVPLMAYLLGKLTAPDSLILDPFAGSGTTGVAALQTGRRFIGVEIDERYAEIAAKRLEKAANDTPLLEAMRA